VPLIVHAPGLPPARVSGRVALNGLVPTVLALVGATPPRGLDGRNLLAPGAAGHPVSCAYFADKNPNGTRTQAVRDGRFVYVERHGRGDNELYDSTADPGERRNLIADPKYAAIAARLKRAITPLSIR
jgi:choline-sulfatase